MVLLTISNGNAFSRRTLWRIWGFIRRGVDPKRKADPEYLKADGSRLGRSENLRKLNAVHGNYTVIYTTRVFHIIGDLDGNGEVAMMNTQAVTETSLRRHERHKTNVNAWLEFFNEAPRSAVSLDLSPEGARFSANRPVCIGERVLVRMQFACLPNPVECKGRVCWTRPAGNRQHMFGVRFVDLSADEQHELVKFLTQENPKQACAAV